MRRLARSGAAYELCGLTEGVQGSLQRLVLDAG
jgi:hypothetical protein